VIFSLIIAPLYNAFEANKMATIFGYGRVSRTGQSSENQRQAIEKHLGKPVDVWYEDHAVSGTVKTSVRPSFSKMVAEAVAGDTLVFNRVDRISRRASDTLTTVEGLLERGVEVYIIQIGKDPLSSAKGKMMLGIFAIFAEDERMALVERTKDGLARVKKNGRILGPKLSINPETLRALCIGRADKITLDVLSSMYGIDRNTILRNVKKWEGSLEEYEAEWNKRDKQYKAKEQA
jgi:putative DNA-invertase from lambdoid prophage Rac